MGENDSITIKARPITDVAINIFAKPYQTALSLLSLLRWSGMHINKIWLQFEPVGSKFDYISPYHIADYLREIIHIPCHIFQPEHWLARRALTEDELQDSKLREGLRYQCAFENSNADYLFIIHNDVYFIKDLLGDLLKNIGDAFAIGPIGQCSNCPARNEEISRKIMNMGGCSPESYQDYNPTVSQLNELYKEAEKNGIFVRPYARDNFTGEFEAQPWPLPECRVNEWACLVNLKKTKPICVPFGKEYPYGAYKLLADHNLDIAVPWFRAMHAHGMKAKHFNISRYMKHWVGTGNKSGSRYTYSEDRARNILKTNYPDYLNWLEKQTGKK